MVESPIVIVSPESDRVQRDYRRLTITIVACIAAGCSGGGAKPSAPAAAKAVTVVRIHSPQGVSRTLLERYGKAWAAIKRAQIEFVDEAHADLIVFAPAELGRLVETSRIRPLPDSIVESELWTSLLRQQRDKLALWGGKPYALPLLADATMLIYRVDLYQKAGRTPPKSLAEYLEQATTWAGERNGVSLPPLPGDEDGLGRLYFTAAAGFEVRPVAENDVRKKAGHNGGDPSIFAFLRRVDDASPRLTERGFVLALGWLRDLQPCRSKAATLVEAFRRGEAIMGLGTLSDFAALEAADPGRYAVAPIPAGTANEPVPYVGPGGALAAVGQSARSPDAAIDLLRFVGEQANEYIHDPSIASAPFRVSHLAEHREGWFNYRVDEAGRQRLLDALRVAVDPRAVNAPVRLRTPDQAEYRRLLLTHVRECVEKKGDPENALREAAAAWQKRDATVPREKLVADYLRSLGLK